MKRIVLLSVVLASSWGFGQDIHFSQYWTQPMTQNPALVGVNFDFAVYANYKDQWRQIGSPYKTFGASIDSRLNRKRAEYGYFAAGVNFFSDKAGDSQMGTSQGNASFAYHIKVAPHHHLGLGLMAGFAQRSINYTYLTWGNQYDGTNYNPNLSTGENFGASQFTHADFAAGFLWSYSNSDGLISVTDINTTKFNVGFSVYHLSRPKYSFLGTDQRLYMKYVLHGSGIIPIEETRYAWIPGIMMYYQGKAKELLIGTMFRIKLQQDAKYTGYKNGAALSFGAYFRARDAISPMLMFEFHQFAVGVSYDVNISNLKAATNTRGGLEISLRFTNKNPFMDGQIKPISRFN
ncbi:MAG: PorP/SprF family type IX secretion system membrane protein [Crocinitomicaceae bacterium]|nr:PorP/SprF family type IX secretion system membrane protein [Crocinitomicaceae bacterium]